MYICSKKKKKCASIKTQNKEKILIIEEHMEIK